MFACPYCQPPVNLMPWTTPTRFTEPAGRCSCGQLVCAVCGRCQLNKDHATAAAS